MRAAEDEVEAMEPNARTIAALEQLDAARVAPENKEWRASRKDISREIEPQAIDVT